VTLRDFAALQGLLHHNRQVKQPEGVSNRHAAFPDSLGNVLMGQRELIRQALVGSRAFNRVQIFPLDIFNDCKFQLFLLRSSPNNRWDVFQTCQLRCPQTAFTSDQRVAIHAFCSNHDQRLDDPMLFDGGGKIFQLFFLKNLARLLRIRADACNR